MPPSNNNAKPLPFVFIVGCPRSGTTLLQRMIDAHPQLAIANDTHFIPQALKHLDPVALEGDLSQLSLTEDLVDRVRTYRRYPRLGLDDSAIDKAAASSSTYPRFVGELYRIFAQMHGKALGGEKTPDYVKCLPLLHGLFPKVKTVHIIRDGRDVALSALQWATKTKGPGKLDLWDDEPVAVCAMWWKLQVGSGLRDARGLPGDAYHELKYEQLVRDPEPILRKVTSFLGLPFSPRMLAFNEGKQRNDSRLSAKKAWLGPTPGIRDWRSELNSRSIELFEALAGDLLSALGYERRFTEISADIADLSNRCQAWWDAHYDIRTIQSPTPELEKTC